MSQESHREGRPSRDIRGKDTRRMQRNARQVHKNARAQVKLASKAVDDLFRAIYKCLEPLGRCIEGPYRGPEPTKADRFYERTPSYDRPTAPTTPAAPTAASSSQALAQPAISLAEARPQDIARVAMRDRLESERKS